MTYEHILVEAEDGVGIVTLNRPDKLNAMNRQLSSELHDAMKRMDADEAIGCIVIAGAGDRAFSAGGDIHGSARMIAATPRRSWMRSALHAAAAMKLPPAQSRRSG
jgi:enoyl-CoA hydratase/carnithine racemase